jgi:hypothetical protein
VVNQIDLTHLVKVQITQNLPTAKCNPKFSNTASYQNILENKAIIKTTLMHLKKATNIHINSENWCSTYIAFIQSRI